jgi:hypothetical protein
MDGERTRRRQAKQARRTRSSGLSLLEAVGQQIEEEEEAQIDDPSAEVSQHPSQADAEQENLQRYLVVNDKASFGGVDRLSRATGLSKKRTQSWLAQQDAYTLHKPARRFYKRNRVEVTGVDNQWQADLVDLQALKQYNDGFNYLLMCLDVFSKYGWAVPLKTKTGKELVQAFQSILAVEGRSPTKLQTDKGTEFLNRNFQEMLRKEGIHFFTTNSELKASVVERWNRTIKERMWRYFTFANTYRYIDILPQLISAYNNSYHSSIKMEPVNVTNDNEQQVRAVLYPRLEPATHFKYSLGDHVRVSKYKKTFEKGYVPNWSEEIYVIKELKRRPEPVYKLEDLLKVPIEGIFYEPELQRVQQKTADSLFVIEKVLSTKGKGARRKHLVKWRGYPESFNTWIDAKEIERI